LKNALADPRCTDSADLTTANPSTTPANNSIAGLPPFAFTPQTDRDTIAPDEAHRTPIVGPVPGLQIEGRIADDSQGQARILIRLPGNWNGRLVVAGTPGTRSEFSSDFAWSDYVIQKGYAYVSQNKGTLNFRRVEAEDSTACRTNLTQLPYVRFYDDDPGMPFTRWATFMAEAAQLGRDAVQMHYGRQARYTYAVGTSNGGYQVRRAVETYPELFDGGVDWEGTLVDADVPNLLSTLPAAILNYPDYAASGFNPSSTAAKNILAAGYPPDLASSEPEKTLWRVHYETYWEVTMCQWQKRLDPTYDTYGAGLANYVYLSRVPTSHVAENLAAFSTTGHIHRPLITVAGTMDTLLPIDDNARAYARRVAAAVQADSDKDAPAYRLYEVQNGNHIDSYKKTFSQLEFIEPHAQQAFDLLVGAVEHHTEMPPSQCIPRGGVIDASPAQPGHCANLLVPGT
jgi:hypothetical protein